MEKGVNSLIKETKLIVQYLLSLQKTKTKQNKKEKKKRSRTSQLKFASLQTDANLRSVFNYNFANKWIFQSE